MHLEARGGCWEFGSFLVSLYSLETESPTEPG